MTSARSGSDHGRGAAAGGVAGIVTGPAVAATGGRIAAYRGEHDVPELLDAIGAAGKGWLSFVYASRGNFNSRAIHGDHGVHNGSANEGLEPREGVGAARLLKLSEGRLTAELPPPGSSGAERAWRPNLGFVFRRSITDLLHTVR